MQPHMILSFKTLNWLFGPISPEDAVRIYADSIGPEEIAQLIRKAGAPEPWQNPDKLPVLIVRTLTSVDRNPQAIQAQSAIDTLRRLLPGILMDEFKELYDLKASSWKHTEALLPFFERRLKNLKRLSIAIEAIEPLISSRKKGPRESWHFDALEFLYVYRDVVNPECGTSADGPAARFIQAGLERLGAGHRDLRAIEQAIRAHEKSR